MDSLKQFKLSASSSGSWSSNWQVDHSGDVVRKRIMVGANSKTAAIRQVEEEEHQKRMNSMTYPFFKIVDVEMIPNVFGPRGRRKSYWVVLAREDVNQ